MTYQAVLFDLDGTLRDTRKVIYESVLYALQAHGAGNLTAADIDPYIHHHTAVHQKFLPSVDLDSFETTYKRRLHDSWAEVEFFPQTLETVRTLRNQGYKLAVVTSASQQGTEDFLRARGVDRLFDSISGVRQGVDPKPAPDLVEDALKKLGLQPEAAIMVGDMAADVTAATAAGLKCIGVSYGFNTATELKHAGAIKIIDSLAELPTLLKTSITDTTA